MSQTYRRKIRFRGNTGNLEELYVPVPSKHMQVKYISQWSDEFRSTSNDVYIKLEDSNGFSNEGLYLYVDEAAGIKNLHIEVDADIEAARPKTDDCEPPSGAEFLLTMLATTRRADAMIGDLNERFTCEYKEFGRARAVRLYWARTLRSLPPLVWRAIGKLVVAVVKRFFGLSSA